MAMDEASAVPTSTGPEQHPATTRTALPCRPMSTRENAEKHLYAKERPHYSAEERNTIDTARSTSPTSSRNATSPSPVPSTSPTESICEPVKAAAGQVCQYVPSRPIKHRDLEYGPNPRTGIAVQVTPRYGGDRRLAPPFATLVDSTRNQGMPLDQLILSDPK